MSESTVVGRVAELTRYPIKSMGGTSADSAFLGVHGLTGDRRFAFRRISDTGGFPWLSASRCPSMLLYHPVIDAADGDPVPTHVRTPDGAELELLGAELDGEVSRRAGTPVALMRLKHGVFDDLPVSVIGTGTIERLCREGGVAPDRRRFRANVVVDMDEAGAFPEDRWVGGMLVFGEAGGPIVSATTRDERCMMINLDPDTARQDAGVMKAAVRMNGNYAGVYATVVRPGTIRVGDVVRLFTALPD